MPDEEPLFVVKGTAVVGGIEKFWTGRMLDSWPVYLRDRTRAHRLPEREAKTAAADFNARAPNFDWTTEPATPA
jgi:hypothetical protein